VSPNDNFRRELNNVFDDVSGTPSPALKDRVRSAVTEAPEARGIYWVAAVAAVVITALIVGVLFVANPLRRPTGSVGPGPTASPSVSSSPQPSPGTTPLPTPTQSTLPPFECLVNDVPTSLQAGNPIAYISDLTTGLHPGYGRVTISFNNGVPHGGVQLKPQTGTSFDGAPSGQSVKTKGTNGIKVIISGADMHTSYSGSGGIITGYSTLVEVRQIEDFEGVVQLAIGIVGEPCYRAFYLSNPTRLVIDIQTPS
jgi:hypothetical protein